MVAEHASFFVGHVVGLGVVFQARYYLLPFVGLCAFFGEVEGGNTVSHVDPPAFMAFGGCTGCAVGLGEDFPLLGVVAGAVLL